MNANSNQASATAQEAESYETYINKLRAIAYKTSEARGELVMAGVGTFSEQAAYKFLDKLEQKIDKMITKASRKSDKVQIRKEVA